MPPVASQPSHPASDTFASALQRVLDEQGISNRELARRLAGTTEEKAVAGRRRQIVRWLNGETENPTRPTRRRVALALGLEPDYFIPAGSRGDVMLARLDLLEQGQDSLEAKVAGRRYYLGCRPR